MSDPQERRTPDPRTADHPERGGIPDRPSSRSCPHGLVWRSVGSDPRRRRTVRRAPPFPTRSDPVPVEPLTRPTHDTRMEGSPSTSISLEVAPYQAKNAGSVQAKVDTTLVS